jgi:hypothetical protein
MNSNIFKGYYKSLDKALDMIPLEKVHAFIFCRRQEIHTVAVIIYNHSDEERKYIDELAGFEIPKHLYSAGEGKRVGIIGLDLPEENNDFVRLYVSDKKAWRETDDDFLYGIGYYLNKNGEVLGKKDYYANLKTGLLNVDYYDAEGNSVDHVKEKVLDNYDVWNGPIGLFDAVKSGGFKYSIGYKDKKDQGYFLVDPNSFF